MKFNFRSKIKSREEIKQMVTVQKIAAWILLLSGIVMTGLGMGLSILFPFAVVGLIAIIAGVEVFMNARLKAVEEAIKKIKEEKESLGV